MMAGPANSRWRRLLRAAEIFFWAAAIVLLGCYALVYLDRNVYQAYQEWAFDRELQHEPAPVVGFLLHSLKFGNSEDASSSASATSGESPDFSQPVPPQPSAVRPAPGPEGSRLAPERPAAPVPSGSIIGRIEIPNAGVRAMVVNGTSNACLRRAVGHIEGTALPGEAGNIGLAGHRDTFFRGLRNIRKGDTILIRTLEGTYEYSVESLRIVGPDDVEVLNASASPTLTLVTCYPFDYIGSAPRRFIVQAREISGPGVTPQSPRGS